MNIPPRTRFLSTLAQGSVYYFEDQALTSPEPHYFVVVNQTPSVDESLVLVCASSQVEKRKQIIQKLRFPEETLVLVAPSEYPVFSRDTVIDCNRVFEKTAETLIEKLDCGKLKICPKRMPDAILQRLIKGICASTQIPNKIKKMLH